MTASPARDAAPVVVVVVEDEAMIRMMAVDLLTDAGFAVHEARDAEEALAILHAQAAAVNVLFTDINMPGAMDGLALAHHARGAWPWIGLLVASGKALPVAAELPAGSAFMAKPYDARRMVAQVRELAGDG